LVCGVVGAGAVVGVIAMSTPEPSPLLAAATGPRGSPELRREIDDGSWGEADLKHCKSEAKAAADAAAERRRRAVSADRAGLGGPSSAMIEQSAQLLCSASRKPLHLCKPYWRKQFIAAIKAYAEDFREVSVQTYWTDFNLSERARRRSANDQADWQTITDDLRQTTRDLARMREEIIAAFRALIADGIIDPGDFGVFFGMGIPPDVAAMIGDARRARRLCG
jgi:hypothetical protein